VSEHTLPSLVIDLNCVPVHNPPGFYPKIVDLHYVPAHACS